MLGDDRHDHRRVLRALRLVHREREGGPSWSSSPISYGIGRPSMSTMTLRPSSSSSPLDGGHAADVAVVDVAVVVVLLLDDLVADAEVAPPEPVTAASGRGGLRRA